MSIIRGTQRKTSGTKKTKAPEDNSGLCSTCIYTPACVNAARAKHPVMYCEEFDCQVISSLRAAESQFSRKEKPRRNVGSARDKDPELKGLCINCDNRKICTHTKPEGGIWHCEEYR